MNVDVIWATNEPGTIARGHWDDSLAEALFAHELWRPPGMPTFVHHVCEQSAWPEVDGAVVVIPARNHATNEHVAWLNEQLARLSWVLLFLHGDEEQSFPRGMVRHPNMRVWVMTPDAKQRGDRDRYIGTGFTPHTRPTLADGYTADMVPIRDWVFAGQITHARREQCAEVLRTMKNQNGLLIESERFTEGVPPDEYVRLLAGAKVAPCPSGPCSVDTFRVWEALEAGCIPMVDGQTPTVGAARFWDVVWPGHPLPIITEWASFPEHLKVALFDWPANANRVGAAWMAYKRNLAYGLRVDIAALSGLEIPDVSVADQVTVVIPTSPVTKHPNTDDLEATIASVRAWPELADCEIIVAADGVRPQQERLQSNYDEYLRRVVWLCQHHWHNVLPVVMPEWGHQANTVRAALERVTTPLILFMEHDTPLTPPEFGKIDWATLAFGITSGQTEVIRFYHEAEIHPDHRHLMVDPELRPQWLLNGRRRVPLVRTSQWSQRPHLASMAFYHRLMDTYFAPESRAMIEDTVYGVIQHYWQTWGESGWAQFRMFIYAEPGEHGSIKRSEHLDSRGLEPKFGMQFAYPGGRAPAGAPR